MIYFPEVGAPYRYKAPEIKRGKFPHGSVDAHVGNLEYRRDLPFAHGRIMS